MSKKLAAKAGLIQLPPLSPSAPQAPTVASDAATPKTAPGSMLHFMVQQSSAVREAEELKERLQAFDGATPVKSLDPRLIRPSRWANRHAAAFESSEFAAFKEEIASAGGNVQPIRVRPFVEKRASGDGEPVQYEIAFGHRRHRACLELGLPVNAVVEKSTDQELFVAMERENRGRQNLSAYEQGCMYRRAIDEGLFPSLRKLADAINVDVGLVSKSISLARLPEAVIEAFPSPLEIQYRWAQPLAEALQRDPDGLLSRAKHVKAKGGAKTAGEVFQVLTGKVLNRSTDFTELKIGDRRAGSMSTDTKGRLLVTLEAGVVPADRKAELIALLQGWISTSK